MASVKSLDNQKIGTGQSSTDFARLKVASQKRKSRHDDAIEGYLKKIAVISEKLENTVLVTAREVQELLDRYDQQIGE